MDKKNAKILVVDDIEMNIHLLEKSLTKLGYQVLAANNGMEALEKVEKEQPDLILLDIMMPDIDGFEVCRQLRSEEKTQFIPIIMVTALTDKKSKVKGLDAGADDFISKPVDNIELTARIRSLLRIKQMQEKLVKTERLAAIGEIVLTVSHHINNPLTILMLTAQVLQHKELPDDILGEIEKLLQASIRINDVVKKIVALEDINKIDTGFRGMQMIDIGGSSEK